MSKNNPHIFTSESVGEGHPDKVADYISDSILDACLAQDKTSRVACETLVKSNMVIIAGELTTKAVINPEKIARQAIREIGYCNGQDDDVFHADTVFFTNLLTEQSPDIAQGVAAREAEGKGHAEQGAGDQGIMFGDATTETAEQMPIPYLVATKFLQLLKNHPSKMFRADAKAQVSYDYGTGRITTFLCSVQHSPDVEVSDFRHIIESMMVLAACEYGLDGDFTKLVNPTGRFVLGGSYADCGVTGRKLACDTYGGIGRMGGGALSGKDPTKVDRSAAYMARKIAKDIVQAGYADKCEVQLAYAIGVIQPVGVAVECFGTEHQSLDFIEAYVHDSYDLTPQGIIKRLGLLDVDYNKVSAYGHFGKAGLPWED